MSITPLIVELLRSRPTKLMIFESSFQHHQPFVNPILDLKSYGYFTREFPSIRNWQTKLTVGQLDDGLSSGTLYLSIREWWSIKKFAKSWWFFRRLIVRHLDHLMRFSSLLKSFFRDSLLLYIHKGLSAWLKFSNNDYFLEKHQQFLFWIPSFL